MRDAYALDALARLAELLEGCEAPWVVGGSTGLLARGARLDREPRDLDVYADERSIEELHDRLAHYATDSPAWSETERYSSVLSHYRIGRTTVELVGRFRVRTNESEYFTEVEHFLFPNGDRWHSDHQEARLVPLGHELLFNLLRDRADRAYEVRELIRRNPERHIPILKELIRRNRLSEGIVESALDFGRKGGAR
jgi:hypothetical protein